MMGRVSRGLKGYCPWGVVDVSRGLKHYCPRGSVKYSVQGTLSSIVPGGSG